MDARTEADRIQLRVNGELNVLDLSNNCPYDQCNPPFCPLHAVREMDRSERIEWIHTLSDTDLEYLTTYHQVCMHWRSANDTYKA